MDSGAPGLRDRFPDDRDAPLYGTELRNDRGFINSVYLTADRRWWGDIEMPETSGPYAYERFRMVAVWLRRAAPILDRITGLPTGAITWRAEFETVLQERMEKSASTYDEVRSGIRVSVSASMATVTTQAPEAFDDAIYHPENIAERALVDALVTGICELAGHDVSEVPGLVQAIMRSPQARHAHAFAPRSFRDHVHGKLDRRVVRVNLIDDASSRLGLGWQVRDRALGGRIEGKEATTSYLNGLVTWLEAKLCDDLKQFNREALIARILSNYERAAVDQSRWMRTASAVLALHDDRASTLDTIGQHLFGLNAVFQASRLLIEAAICEASLEGGRAPGELDITRLMATVLQLFHMGGWSDAIKWDVMEPILRITPLGDVHAKLDYIDEIITPHARESSEVAVEDAVENYAENLKQFEGTKSVDDTVDARFLKAWQEEYGTSFQQMRVFIDWLENRGVSRGEPIMRMSASDFVEVDAHGESLPADVVERILDKLTLAARPSWRVAPDGFQARDRDPWRFRRRLSLLRRPILKLGQDNVPYLIAPGLVRDGFGYIVQNLMRGDFPGYQLSAQMKSWAARQADSRGKRFTEDVAQALRDLGWKAETEVKVTKILRRSLERDYGDVDVLAWNDKEGRVLIVECKDVHYRKTYGEISEQLADFRGGYRPDGKPDYLRRHLDRMDVFRGDSRALGSYLANPSASLKIESHLIFRNPVPMRYALARIEEKVRVSTFAEISNIVTGF